MNREQAKKEAFIETNMANTSGIVWVTDTFVDKIYDSFENQTCRNCKYGEPVLADTKIWCRGNTPYANINSMSMDKDFGCNKWEAKDD